jgi:hypothetical protein
MEYSLLRIPVVCPECGKELLTELPAASIAEALASGSSIHLYAQCHDKAWNADGREREQVRDYWEAAQMSR